MTITMMNVTALRQYSFACWPVCVWYNSRYKPRARAFGSILINKTLHSPFISLHLVAIISNSIHTRVPAYEYG